MKHRCLRHRTSLLVISFLAGAPAALAQTSATWSQYGGTRGDNSFTTTAKLGLPLSQKWKFTRPAAAAALGAAVVDGGSVYVASDGASNTAPYELSLSNGDMARMYASRHQIQNLNTIAVSQNHVYLSDDGVERWVKGNVEKMTFWYDQDADKSSFGSGCWAPNGSGQGFFRHIDYWGPHKVDYATGEHYVTSTVVADGPHELNVELWDLSPLPSSVTLDPPGTPAHKILGRTLRQRPWQWTGSGGANWDAIHNNPASVALTATTVFHTVNPGGAELANTTQDYAAGLYALRRARTKAGAIDGNLWQSSTGCSNSGVLGVRPEDTHWSVMGNFGGVTSDEAGNRLFAVKNNDRKLYALATSDGHELWSAAVSGDTWHPPAFAPSRGVVVVLTNDARLHAFSATGAPLWQGDAGGGPVFAMEKINRLATAMGGGSGGGLYREVNAHVLSALAVSETTGENGVVVVANGDVVKAFDLKTGAAVWNTTWNQGTDGPVGNPVIVDAGLIVTSKNAVALYWGEGTGPGMTPGTGGAGGTGGGAGMTGSSGGAGGSVNGTGGATGGNRTGGMMGTGTGGSTSGEAGAGASGGQAGEAGLGGDGDTGGNGGAASDDATSGESASGGCGCQVSATPTPGNALLLALVTWMLRRRRRPRV